MTIGRSNLAPFIGLCVKHCVTSLLSMMSMRKCVANCTVSLSSSSSASSSYLQAASAHTHTMVGTQIKWMQASEQHGMGHTHTHQR